MSQQAPTAASFSLNGKDLTNSAITAVRVGLGLAGLVALVVGVLLTFWTKEAAIALTWLIGIYFVVAGVGYVVVAVFARGLKTGARVLDIVLGVLQVAAGIIILSNATASAWVLGIFLGVWIGILWIVEGAIALVQSGDAPSRGWAIFFGALSIVAGIILLFSPLYGAIILFWLAGISLIITGVLQLLRAFRFGRGLPAA